MKKNASNHLITLNMVAIYLQSCYDHMVSCSGVWDAIHAHVTQ